VYMCVVVSQSLSFILNSEVIIVHRAYCMVVVDIILIRFRYVFIILVIIHILPETECMEDALFWLYFIETTTKVAKDPVYIALSL